MSRAQKVIDDFLARAGIEAIEPEMILKFINDTTNRRPTAPNHTMQAAALLAGLRQGLIAGDDVGKELRRLLRIKKSRSKIYDPSTAYMGTPEFVIVQQYVSEKIPHKEAVKQFNKIHPASRRQIENWIAAIKPNVEVNLDNISNLIAFLDKKAK